MKNKLIILASFLFIFLIIPFASATIQLTKNPYGNNEPNHYIELIADSGGEGNSWDEAFSFEKIVDYFKDHPVGEIDYPNNAAHDATEYSDWNWYWGTYALATQTSNTNDAVIEVDNTSGFTASGQIRNLQSIYTDYIDYTNISGNNFTGCTWGNYIGSSLNKINSGAEIFQLKTGNWVYNTTDYKNGSNSMQYTHDNNGSRVLVMANAKMDDEIALDMIKLNMYSAEKIGFWVKVSNPNIRIESVETRDEYSSTYVYQYGKDIPVNETINSTDWVWKEYDFRELGLDIKRSSRDWQFVVDSFIIRFSNVSNGDVIKIDGVKWWIDNATPREIKPNVYLFPIGIYDYQNQNNDFYFWDYGHNIIFNMPCDKAFYHYERAHHNYIRIGYEGAGYPTSKNPQGEVIFWNTWSNGYIYFNFLGDGSHLDYNSFEMYGTHFMSASPTLDGIYPRLNSFGYENNVIKDSIIEEGGDFFIGNFKVIDNVQLKMHRYSPWGAPKDDAEVYNLKDWLNQNYMWVDAGTIRHMEIASARNHAGYYWISGRSYGHQAETETDLIDGKYPDGFFGSDAYYTFAWTIYDTYSEGHYNYPHLFKIGNSVQVIVKDSSGNAVEGASVVVKDKNGTIVWSGTTNADGETDRFDTFWRQTYISAGDGSASTHNVYMYNKDNDKDYDWGWATGYTHTYYPFTVEVSKDGYQTGKWVDNFNQTDSINGYTLNLALLSESITPSTNYAPVFYGILMFFILALSIYFTYIAKAIYSNQMVKGLLNIAALFTAGVGISLIGYGVREYIKIESVTSLIQDYYYILATFIFVIFIYNLYILLYNMLKGFKSK